MQSLWDAALASWPYDDRLFFTACFCVGHSVLTLPYNAVALILHLFPNNFLAQWKIQADSAPSQRLIKEVVVQICVNHFFTSPLLAYFGLWPLFQALGMSMHGPLPSALQLISQLVIFMVINDALFYWAHRLLHTFPWLYKKVHSQHHRFTTPISWAAEFAHPVEALLANTIPTLAGPFIMRAHLFTIFVWMIVRMWETLDAHGGFDFPFSPWRLLSPVLLGAEGHDWHHSHNRGNYGVSRFWDLLMGTDAEFKRWQHGESVPAEVKELKTNTD